MADNQQGATPIEPTTETAVTNNQQQSGETLESYKAKLESAEKRIGELNKESEKHRKQADEWQKAKQAEEDAKLSETEKLKKQLDEVNAAKESVLKTANDRLVSAEIKSKSDKFIDPDVVLALVDRSKITVKDDGTIEGVTAALDELAKNKPILLKQPQGSKVGASNPGATGANESPQQKHERLLGGMSNPFAMGGGIVWGPDKPE